MNGHYMQMITVQYEESHFEERHYYSVQFVHEKSSSCFVCQNLKTLHTKQLKYMARNWQKLIIRAPFAQLLNYIGKDGRQNHQLNVLFPSLSNIF